MQILAKLSKFSIKRKDKENKRVLVNAKINNITNAYQLLLLKTKPPEA